MSNVLVQELWDEEGHSYVPSMSAEGQHKALQAWLAVPLHYDKVSLLMGGDNPYSAPEEDLLIDFYDDIENWLTHEFENGVEK